MAEDQIDETVGHIQRWLQGRANAGITESDLGQTGNELPQKVVQIKARSLRSKFNKLLEFLPEFNNAAPSAYFGAIDYPHQEQPPVVFKKDEYIYFYTDMFQEENINHLVLRRKKIEKAENIGVLMESAERDFNSVNWDDEVHIANYTGEGNEAGIAYKGHDNFQWKKTSKGSIKTPLTNTPYVVSKIDEIYDDLASGVKLGR